MNKACSCLKTTILLSGLIAVLILACEGYSCDDGVVYDLNSRIPIDSVLCVSNGGDEVYTNSLGRYSELCSPFGGCIPKCSDLEIEFSKIGYNTHTEAKRFDTIYLEKIDTIKH